MNHSGKCQFCDNKISRNDQLCPVCGEPVPPSNDAEDNDFACDELTTSIRKEVDRQAYRGRMGIGSQSLRFAARGLVFGIVSYVIGMFFAPSLRPNVWDVSAIAAIVIVLPLTIMATVYSLAGFILGVDGMAKDENNFAFALGGFLLSILNLPAWGSAMILLAWFSETARP